MRAIQLGEVMDAEKAANNESSERDDSWLVRFKRWQHRHDRKLTSSEQALHRLAEFAVDVFDGQFSKQDVIDGVDFADLVTMLKSILSRARGMPGLPGNPTNPPQMKPKAVKRR